MKKPLPAFSSIGGYPIVYVRNGHETLCPNCASKENEVLESFIHWEGSSHYCEDCNKEIESAYGNPEEEGA